MCNELNVKSPATLYCSVQQTNMLLTILDCCAVLNQNMRIVEFNKLQSFYFKHIAFERRGNCTKDHPRMAAPKRVTWQRTV